MKYRSITILPLPWVPLAMDGGPGNWVKAAGLTCRMCIGRA